MVNKFTAKIAFAFLLFASIDCQPPAGTPSPTLDIPAVESEPSASSASPTSSPILPSPAPQSTPLAPAVIAETIHTPESDFESLAHYRAAMLPEFAGDIDLIAAAGASRYYLEVRLEFPEDGSEDQQGPHLSGIEQIQYTNTEDVALSEIYFRLYPNLPGYGGRMTIERVLVDGQAVEPVLEAEESALRVPLARPLSPGAVADVNLTYNVDIPLETQLGYNIFSYTDNTITLAGFYPAIAVYDDEGWNVEVPPPYGDATYLDTSLYQVNLTVPEEMVVTASGSLLKSQSHPDGTKTLSLVSGPMRDFYIAMREDFQTTSEIVDGVTVTSYYPPELQAGGILALQYAADSLGVFSQRFGQYPYAEFDVVAAPTTAGGVEYPGIVVISQNLYGQQGGFFQHATSHEVAHQWWYGLVGNDQVDEPWLDESLTNYSTVLYWEEVAGEEAANNIVNHYFLRPYEQVNEQGRDRAVAGPVAAFNEVDYGLFVYGKGPLFFDALRQEVGDEVFLAAMRTYYSEFRYEIARPEDLLEIIERVSGQKVDSLYETWIQH